MNIRQIKPERRLRLLKEYIDLLVDKWPDKPKPFAIWLESKFDKAAYKGAMQAREKFKKKCRYCQRPFDEYVEKTKDHIIAQSIGGKDSKHNKVQCCWDCNQWKSDKSLKDWLKELKRIAKKDNIRKPYDSKLIGLMIMNLNIVIEETAKNQQKMGTYKFK